jgi:hypothetical protein
MMTSWRWYMYVGFRRRTCVYVCVQQSDFLLFVCMGVFV